MNANQLPAVKAFSVYSQRALTETKLKKVMRTLSIFATYDFLLIADIIFLFLKT